MRPYIIALLSLFLVISVVAIASAESQDPAAAGEATRIAVDEEAAVIRFFIEGEEKARLDAAGLHVRENIDYGGTLTDYGRSGFDNRAGRKEYERLKAEGRDAR